MKRKYELKPQDKDSRDYKLKLTFEKEVPKKIDLRPICPPVFDQGSLGSCSANAGVSARMMLSNIRVPLSRLYLYYKERELEGTTKEDSGATMRAVCKALQKYGTCKEICWPYRIEKYAKRPCCIANLAAKKYKICSYKCFDTDEDTDDIMQIKQYLFATHRPVLIGVQVYDSFESNFTTETGFIPIPDTTKEALLGGHAILVVGFDDNIQSFIIMNSWGKDWGDNGFGYLPYDFVTLKFAFDFWVIE